MVTKLWRGVSGMALRVDGESVNSLRRISVLIDIRRSLSKLIAFIIVACRIGGGNRHRNEVSHHHRRGVLRLEWKYENLHVVIGMKNGRS